jgi:hypothetical protein
MAAPKIGAEWTSSNSQAAKLTLPLLQTNLINGAFSIARFGNLPIGGMSKTRASSMAEAARVFTIGHSTRTIDEFIALLTDHQITRLVDVRTIPRSRANPQFNKDVLPASLKKARIAYVHVPALGGLRKTRADSPNGAWRNLSFRGYADYMQTPEFAEGIDVLLDWMLKDRLALMCAEAVPWRCHRSLIADALTVRGVRVEEIISATKTQVHKMTPFAKVRGLTITYPPEKPSEPSVSRRVASK